MNAKLKTLKKKKYKISSLYTFYKEQLKKLTDTDLEISFIFFPKHGLLLTFNMKALCSFSIKTYK